MSKYSGICIARQETVRYTTLIGEHVKEIHGVSTTMPMVCEKDVYDRETIVGVFMPQAENRWIFFSGEDFEAQFLIVQGWQLEQT
jgi:hypothetical protein